MPPCYKKITDVICYFLCPQSFHIPTLCQINSSPSNLPPLLFPNDCLVLRSSKCCHSHQFLLKLYWPYTSLASSSALHSDTQQSLPAYFFLAMQFLDTLHECSFGDFSFRILVSMAISKIFRRLLTQENFTATSEMTSLAERLCVGHLSNICLKRLGSKLCNDLWQNNCHFFR